MISVVGQNQGQNLGPRPELLQSTPLPCVGGCAHGARAHTGTLSVPTFLVHSCDRMDISPNTSWACVSISPRWE
jgi:hypothetical protein